MFTESLLWIISNFTMWDVCIYYPVLSLRRAQLWSLRFAVFQSWRRRDEINFYSLCLRSAGRRLPLMEMRSSNPTRQSATGIGWTWSWTGWRTCCPSATMFAPAWINCPSCGSAWATCGSRTTSPVSPVFLFSMTFFCFEEKQNGADLWVQQSKMELRWFPTSTELKTEQWRPTMKNRSCYVDVVRFDRKHFIYLFFLWKKGEAFCVEKSFRWGPWCMGPHRKLSFKQKALPLCFNQSPFVWLEVPVQIQIRRLQIIKRGFYYIKLHYYIKKKIMFFFLLFDTLFLHY